MKNNLSKIVSKLLIVILIGGGQFSYAQKTLLVKHGEFRQKGKKIVLHKTNWKNDATATLDNGSSVYFSGNVDQEIDGTNSTAFANLRINNSGTHGVIVKRNIQVLGTLTMSTGYLDLKDYEVDLSTTGTLTGETETSRVRATDASWYDGRGTGRLKATRDNPSGNVAGLGLYFTPSYDLGNNTVIERGHNELQGSGTYTGNYSIYRWYKITPGNSISQLTIDQFNYFGGNNNPELNGHTETQLQMFQEVNYGGPTYWEPRSSSVDATNDYVSSSTTSDPIALNYILITLGSTSKPLPVELTYFNAICKNNTNILTWQTASEYNNAGFNLEKSNNGIDWENFAFVEGVGNSNNINSYNYEDNSPYWPITYYRLQQVDFDGNSKYSDIVSVQCNEKDINEDMHPFFSNGHIMMDIVGNISDNYTIVVTNSIGQIMTLQNIKLSSTAQSVIIENQFAAGLYYISLISERGIITKPIVITGLDYLK